MTFFPKPSERHKQPCATPSSSLYIQRWEGGTTYVCSISRRIYLVQKPNLLLLQTSLAADQNRRITVENWLSVLLYFCLLSFPASMITSGRILNSKLLSRVAYGGVKSSSIKMATGNLGAGEQAVEKPWHAAYPAPKTTAAGLTRETLLSWMLEGKVAGKDFVLVDLRRTDFEVRSGGLIQGRFPMAAI